MVVGRGRVGPVGRAEGGRHRGGRRRVEPAAGRRRGVAVAGRPAAAATTGAGRVQVEQRHVVLATAAAEAIGGGCNNGTFYFGIFGLNPYTD